MKQQNPDLDVILVPGDLVTHGLSSDKPEEAGEMYGRLTGTLDAVSALFQTYFSSVIVLPTIGNNDTEYHYAPPSGPRKKEYYQTLIKDWFTVHTANQNLPELADIKSTVADGGWYRVDIPGADLSVLALDTLFYDTKNWESPTSAAQNQLDWLESQLSGAI